MSKIDVQLLPNDWIHSFEEGSDKEMVFRPSTYKFPPSRQGRTTLNLKPDGDLIYGDPNLGPDDRRIQNKSSWKLDKDTLILHDKESDSKKMKVLSVVQDKLVLEN